MDMKQIPNFPNYSITKGGRVWSHKPKKWLKPKLSSNGRYLFVNLGRKHTCNIHRLVLETYVGPCPKGMECRHLNGNGQDNRLENLCWGTRSENRQDSIQHGTQPKPWLGKYGEQSPTSKLSNYQRRMILYQYATGLFSQNELAQEYKICRSVINHLIIGRSWPFIDIRKLHV